MNIDLTSIGTFVSHLVTQPIHWLWHTRIPLGHLTLLEGPTALGKLLLTLDLAAHTSNNRPLPGDQHGAPGSVILITPNDHHTDTLKPRLEAANADPTNILLLNNVPQDNPTSPQRPFTLPEDLELLEATITRIAATLVIIQPLDSVFSRRAASRRTVFTQLAELARRTHCAILLVRSTSGTHSDSSHLTTGPLDLLDAIDSRLLLMRNPEDSEQHLLVCTKHSLCQEPATLAYHIITNPQGYPIIHWLGESQHPQARSLDTSLPSKQRQRILDLLQQSPTPLRPDPIARHLDQSYQSTCKLLQRMVTIGHLISPSRGLYTTPDHPKLTQLVSSSNDEPTSTPVHNVQSPVPDRTVHPPVHNVQNVQMQHLEHPPVHNVQMAHLEHPPVHNVQMAHLEHPPVHNVQMAHLEHPPVHNVQMAHLEHPPVHNVQSVQKPAPKSTENLLSKVSRWLFPREQHTSPVQSVQMDHLEHPPVQTVQNVQMEPLEQLPVQNVQNVQMDHLEHPPVQNVQSVLMEPLDPPPVHTVQNVAVPEKPDPYCYYGHTIVQQAPPDISLLPDIVCNYGHPAVQQALPDSTGHPSPDFLCIYGHRIVQKAPPDPTAYGRDSSRPVQSVQSRKFSP